MPSFSAIWRFFQYLPVIMEVSKAILPKQEEGRRDTATHEELDDFKQNVSERISELENEQTRLRARIRDVETALSWTQTLLYIALIALALVFIFFVIGIAVMLAKH